MSEIRKLCVTLNDVLWVWVVSQEVLPPGYCFNRGVIRGLTRVVTRGLARDVIRDVTRCVTYGLNWDCNKGFD